jgi:anthranilate phosphoribosyltransferase
MVEGHSLSLEEATDCANAIMEGEATPAQMGAFLTALRMKGETIEEATAFAQAMRARKIPVFCKTSPLLDTCGTGGGTLPVFNVSTTAAFVLAGAGVAVAKHGNRAMSGVCGSADVLEALGVNLDLTPTQIATCIDIVGIGFLFAQKHHPAMKQVAVPRKEIGFRTLFNLLGPLTNPAGATYQVMGVYAPHLLDLAIGTLRALNCERAMVLHGAGGMVEISTHGETYFRELVHGEILSGILTPESFGLTGTPPLTEHLAPAPTPAENATLLRNVLSGAKKTPSEIAQRDLVAVNAAAALRVRGLVQEWKEGYHTALEVIDSGKALAHLEHLIQRSQGFAD